MFVSDIPLTLVINDWSHRFRYLHTSDSHSSFAFSRKKSSIYTGVKTEKLESSKPKNLSFDSGITIRIKIRIYIRTRD